MLARLPELVPSEAHDGNPTTGPARARSAAVGKSQATQIRRNKGTSRVGCEPYEIRKLAGF